MTASSEVAFIFTILKFIHTWNEYDEGGWLQPTRGADGKADDSRIHALGKALRALPMEYLRTKNKYD